PTGEVVLARTRTAGDDGTRRRLALDPGADLRRRAGHPGPDVHSWPEQADGRPLALVASDRATSVGAASADAPGRRMARAVVRIPPNFFGMALGLSGLEALWLYASAAAGAPAAVGDALALLAAATGSC